MQAIFKWLVNLFKAIFGLSDTTVTIEPNPSYPELDDPIDMPDPEPIPVDTSPKDPTKYAVLIGINKYLEPGNDLLGCVNDVEQMWDILVNLYSFDPSNIRVLTDERATRAGILEQLHWLVADRVAGDELFLHYSGHGSQVVDWDGDELNDGLDEILVPYDADWDYPLKDDDIYEIFKLLNSEAYLTFVCDSCHSGTMTRSMESPYPAVGVETQTAATPKSISAFDGKLIRDPVGGATQKFIRPPVDVMLRSKKRELKLVHFGMKEKDIPGEQRHVLLSGCRDHEYSSDALINDKYQGALTAALAIAITYDPYRSWFDIHKDIVAMLIEAEFEQNPRLSGDANLTTERIALGGKS